MGSFPAIAQDRDTSPDIEAEIGTIWSEGEQIPFWLHANKDGIVDREGANGYTRLSFQKEFQPLGPVRLSAGADLVGRLSPNRSVFFNQGWVQAGWWILQFTAGRKAEVIGLQDSSLTGGSMVQSRNASPIPKIRVETPGFVDIPGTNGWLGFKGYFSHGWLGERRVAEGAWLHQKYLYLRLLPEDYWVNGYAGFTHNVIWGGNHPRYGQLPQSFGDYIKVFFGRPATDESVPNNEQIGTLGSTVAGYDTGLKFELENYRIFARRLFYLEDRPGLVFRNPWDGVWGLSIKRKNGERIITGFTWQHLRSFRQGSKSFEPRGTDNYYNNSIYWSGWTYRNRTLGSPFLFSDGVTPGVVNNILVMHHLGIEGVIDHLFDYRFFASYSRNYGAGRIFEDPEGQNPVSGRTERKDQYSLALETTSRLDDNFWLRLNLAYDTGELYEDRFGAQAAVMFRF